MAKRRLYTILNSHETVGRVVREYSFLEFSVDSLIAVYYVHDSRFEHFFSAVLAEISFNQKLNILKQLADVTQSASMKEAVAILTSLRKLRNFLAHHSYYIDQLPADIAADKRIQLMLSDFPKNYLNQLRAVKMRLHRLSMSQSVRNPSLRKVPA